MSSKERDIPKWLVEMEKDLPISQKPTKFEEKPKKRGRRKYMKEENTRLSIGIKKLKEEPSTQSVSIALQRKMSKKQLEEAEESKENDDEEYGEMQINKSRSTRRNVYISSDEESGEIPSSQPTDNALETDSKIKKMATVDDNTTSTKELSTSGPITKVSKRKGVTRMGEWSMLDAARQTLLREDGKPVDKETREANLAKLFKNKRLINIDSVLELGQVDQSTITTKDLLDIIAFQCCLINRLINASKQEYEKDETMETSETSKFTFHVKKAQEADSLYQLPTGESFRIVDLVDFKYIATRVGRSIKRFTRLFTKFALQKLEKYPYWKTFNIPKSGVCRFYLNIGYGLPHAIAQVIAAGLDFENNDDIEDLEGEIAHLTKIVRKSLVNSMQAVRSEFDHKKGEDSTLWALRRFKNRMASEKSGYQLVDGKPIERIVANYKSTLGLDLKGDSDDDEEEEDQVGRRKVTEKE